jgi:hypothetical protein
MSGAFGAQAAFTFVGAGISGTAARQQEITQRARIELANTNIIREAAQEMSSALLMQTILRRNASNALRNAQSAALGGSASAETLASAAGLKGASIDAVIQDVDRELGFAQRDIEESTNVERFNITQRIKSIASARKAQLMQPNAVRSRGDVLRNAIFETVGSSIDTYSQQQFQFGSTS